MKSYFTLFLFLSIFLFTSCSEDDTVTPIEVDTDGPELYDVQWIDHPSIENDPTGEIVNDGNYTISIASGFQFKMGIRDESEFASGVVYFLVNNDESKREDIIFEGTITGNTEGPIVYIHRVDKIWLGGGDYYNLQPGDTYHFYAQFSDIHGNNTSMSWTADLIE